MPFVKIDDTEYQVPKDKTVLEVALDNDIEIPHYCYHPALEIAGSCRMCLVQIEGMPKLQVSCNTFIGEVPPERKVEGKYDMVVHTKNKRFYSKKALVTVPLGVLKSGYIEFSPSLPESKQNAISQLGMGLLQKHWLLFDKVFWDEDVIWILSVNEQNWECMNYTFTGKPMLLCFTMGEYAKSQETLPDSIITSDIMGILRDTYGQSISDPLDVHYTKWASDKFSYGAYSYTAVGNTPETYFEISAPIKNLIFFAGEHTHENYPATIHGAYLSGLRAAKSMK